MTLYAGEFFRITSVGVDFDGTILTDGDVSDVTITIFDSDGEEVIDAAMTWDAEDEWWVYMWDTEGVDPGTYRYRILYEDPNGHSSWEWKRIRLARNPL